MKTDTRLLPQLPTPRHLWLTDLRVADGATILAVATLAGVINAREPQLFLVQRDDDLHWLEATRPVEGNWLPAGEYLLQALLTRYAGWLRGAIIVDDRVPESINVATLLAVRRACIVATPALWERLAPHWPGAVITDLREHGWRSSLEAARWSWHNLRAGSASDRIAGLEPHIGGYLRPYLMVTRTWLSWLHPARARPEWHTKFTSEKQLLQTLLHNYGGGIYLGWFADEPRGVRAASRAGVLVLPSDFCSNLEIWSGFPAPAVLHQTPSRPPPLEPKVYVSFILGEGDNLQYDQHRLFQLWQDPARGTVPIGWTISPLLLEAAPPLAQYFYQTATVHDEFIAGPSGAGYGYPSLWPDNQLTAYLDRTRQMMARMDLHLVQILDLGPGQRVPNPEVLRRYAQEVRPAGILHGSAGPVPEWRIVAGIPAIANMGLIHNEDEAVSLIAQVAQSCPRPYFLSLFVLAWRMGPTELRRVVARLPADIVAVKPGELVQLGSQTFGRSEA